MKKMYYSYVLKSHKDVKMYMGYTKDLKLRFEQHEKGRVEATKHRRPYALEELAQILFHGAGAENGKYD